MFRPQQFVIFVLFLTFSMTAAAESGDAAVLTFPAWRAQQVLEAQNQALRISARINQSKSAKSVTETKGSTAKAAPGTRVKAASDNESLSVLERDLKRAQDSLLAANNLQLDDYINIYIPSLQDQPDALKSLAEKLSKEDLVEIFKGLVKRGGRTNDATSRSSPSLEGLTLSAHPKSY